MENAEALCFAVGATGALGTFARSQDFGLFLLGLFDFFFLTVVAFTHNKLLVGWLEMRVETCGKSAMGKTMRSAKKRNGVIGSI